MTATQLPGQTLEPLPANSGPVSDDRHSLLQKCVENAYNLASNNGGTGQHALWDDDDFALLSKLLYNLGVYAASTVVTGDWILATGFWNNSGEWDNGAVWID